MSSQPHTLLPWVVRRTRLPLLSLRCVGCGSESATTGEGRFRVNANGNLLDPMLAQRNHFSLVTGIVPDALLSPLSAALEAIAPTVVEKLAKPMRFPLPSLALQKLKARLAAAEA